MHVLNERREASAGPPRCPVSVTASIAALRLGMNPGGQKLDFEKKKKRKDLTCLSSCSDCTGIRLGETHFPRLGMGFGQHYYIK